MSLEDIYTNKSNLGNGPGQSGCSIFCIENTYVACTNQSDIQLSNSHVREKVSFRLSLEEQILN